MSLIEALSIVGVRSFGSDEPQIIEFGKPLTVIVGANGCGKTTIIECLKYATTGEMPPSSDAGKSFVHDLKIADRAEVKAQIRLKFKNRVPQVMVVTRDMQVVESRGKLKFSALDTTLALNEKDATGRRNARLQTFSPTKMDSLIPELLGVPKSVLGHVIFCHQENSNWPLAEGSELKKRFDEIFESTQYTKALDDIRKLRKEKEQARKDAEAIVTAAEGKLTHMREVKMRIDSMSVKVDDVNARAEEQNEFICGIEGVLDGLSKTTVEVDRIRREVDHVRAAVKTTDDAIASLDRGLKSAPPDSRAALEELRATPRAEFEAQSKALEAKQEAYLAKVKSLREEANAARQAVRTLGEQKDKKTGALQGKQRAEADMKVAQESLKEAAVAAERDLREKHGFVMPEELTVLSLERALKASKTSIVAGQDEVQRNLRPRLDKARTALNEARRAEAADKANLTQLDRALATAEVEARSAKQALDGVRASADGGDVANEARETRIGELTVAAQNARKTVSDTGPELKGQKDALEDTQRALDKLRRDFDAANRRSNKQAGVEALLMQATDESTALDNRRSELASRVRDVLPLGAATPSSDKLATVVGDRVGELQVEVDRLNEAVSAAKDKTTTAKERQREAAQAAAGLVKQLGVSAAAWASGDRQELVEQILGKDRREALAFSNKLRSVDLVDEIAKYGVDGYVPQASLLPLASSPNPSVASMARMIGSFRLASTILEEEEQFTDVAILSGYFKSALDEVTSHGPCSLCSHQPTNAADEASMINSIKMQLSGGDSTIEKLKVQVQDAANKTKDDVVIRIVNLTFAGEESFSELAGALQKRQQFLEQTKALRDVAAAFHSTLAELKTVSATLPALHAAVKAAEATAQTAQSALPRAVAQLAEARKLHWEATVVSAAAQAIEARRRAISQDSALDDMGKLKEEIAALQKEIKTKEEKVLGLRGVVDDLSKAFNDAHSKLTRASDEITRLSKEKHEADRLATQVKSFMERYRDAVKRQTELDNEQSEARVKADASARAVETALPASRVLETEYSNTVSALERALGRVDDHLNKVQGALTIRMREAKDAMDRAGQATAATDAEAFLSKLHEEIRENDARAERANAEVDRLQAEIKKLSTVQASISDVRRLNDLHEKRAEQKEQVERLQGKLQGLVMTLLMNDDVRAVIPDVEVTGVGMQQVREASRKGVGVIDIDEEEGAGGGSKRRRVTLDADAAFARAVKAFHDNLTEHKIAKARLEGEAKTTTEGLKVDRVRMTSAELKNCDTEYSTALTEATVLEAAVRDLDLYYSALDKALMRYHALKIAEINSSIAELWSLTYKGTDIEKIEIKSDMSDVGEDGAVIPVAPTTGRTSKSYNYRVVMTKSGRELDMRGRCSAGQKVLASIVIRLALAESFCVSTGILALDEPTTNLDAPNKHGLAMALSRIIDARKADNLQLIIITHDEDFVKEMGRAGKEGGGSSSENQMGKYYRVFRQEVGGGVYHSRIEVLDDTE